MDEITIGFIFVVLSFFGMGYIIYITMVSSPNEYQATIDHIDFKIHIILSNSSISQQEKFSIIQINCRAVDAFTPKGISECESYFSKQYLSGYQNAT